MVNNSIIFHGIAQVYAFCGLLVSYVVFEAAFDSCQHTRKANRCTTTHKIAVFESEKLSETFVLVNSVVVGNNAFPVCRCLLEAKQTNAFQLRYFYLGGGITSEAHFAMAFATFSTGLVLPGIPN